MRKKIILWSFALVALNLHSQMQLPNKVKVWLPSYIQNSREMDNSKWLGKIQNEDYGRETSELWVAYSDRNQNKTYSSPSISSPTGKVLDFREQVIIADINKGFALIYIDGASMSTYKHIGSDAVCKGWIPIDNLLLWDKCPMDKYNVFQKAVVLKDVKSLSKEINPFFLSNPETKSQTDQQAYDLDFLFIFKKYKIEGVTYFLLGTEWDIKNSTGGVKANLYGWMDDGNVTSWDNRVCFEPVYDRKSIEFYNSKEIRPSIFRKDKDAQNYFENGKGDETKCVWRLEEQLGTTRQDPYKPRFPLIDDHGNILNIATIGNIGAKKGKLDQDDLTLMKRHLEELLSIKENANILFVIDGTVSMSKYYEPLAKAIEQSRYSSKIDNKQKLRFGAVIYRDYMDGNRLLETMPLTNDFDEVSGFINKCQTKQEAGDPTFEEAMFNGLLNACKLLNGKEKESNFIFLIGDCGNHEIDPRGYNEGQVINALFEKRVNILAFQANNNYKMASSRFSIQANRIIDGLVGRYSSKIGSPNSIGLRLGKNNLYETYKKESDELPTIICKYTFCDLNKSKTPEELNRITLKMIEDFNKYINKNILDLRKTLDGNTEKGPKIRGIDILKEDGYTDEQIHEFIESRKVLKFDGYTSNNPLGKGYNIFEPVLFISGEELGSLVKELKKIDSPTYVSQRRAYEDALSNLARAFFGLADVSSINIDDLFKKLYGINFKPGSFVIKKGNNIVPIKIEWITKPEIVSDDLLKSLIANFAGKTRNLNLILSKDTSEYKFKSNNIPYYYIPIKELP